MPATGAMSRMKSNSNAGRAPRCSRYSSWQGESCSRRRRPHHHLRADIVAGTGPLFDNKRLTEALRKPLPHQAREDVIAAARGRRDDPVPDIEQSSPSVLDACPGCRRTCRSPRLPIGSLVKCHRGASALLGGLKIRQSKNSGAGDATCPCCTKAAMGAAMESDHRAPSGCCSGRRRGGNADRIAPCPRGQFPVAAGHAGGAVSGRWADRHVGTDYRRPHANGPSANPSSSKTSTAPAASSASNAWRGRRRTATC